MATQSLTDWTNTHRVLEEFGQRLIDSYKRELGSRGKIASGRLVDELRYEVRDGDYRISVMLHLSEYWKFVEGGRKPGKFPPVDAIRKWIEVKPIVPRPDKNGRLPTIEQLSFLIGRKIATQGIPAMPALKLSLDSVYQQMVTAVGEALAQDLGERVTQVFVYGNTPT